MRPDSQDIRLALSIRQPHAELILRGEKTTEVRSRPTRVRERIYIYTPQKWDDIPDHLPPDLDIGVIVGSVEIVGCIRDGNLWHWLLSAPARLEKPIEPTKRPQPVYFKPF